MGNKKKNNRKRNVMDVDTPTLHRKPIRIPKRSIREGHNMGCTLFLIVTFNLALAHHHKAVKKTDSSSSSFGKLLNSTVQLYELANNWQYPSRSNHSTDEDDDSSDDEDDTINSMDENDTNNAYSTRFTSILYNNLNHLRQMMVYINYGTKSRSVKRRLDNLLDTITHVLINDDESDDNHVEQQCYEQQQSPLSNHNSRFVTCELEFEYYNKKDLNEFYEHEEELRRKRFSPTTATKQNGRWGERVIPEKEHGSHRFSSPHATNTNACTVMRTSSSFLRLQND